MEGESSHYTNKLHGNSNCGQQQYMNSTSTQNSHCDKHRRILYYNARSLLPKLDELHALITIKTPHIVCIVETWLSSDILHNELQLPGYQVLRLDRDRHGGGVLMYIHDLLSYKVLVEGGPFNLEFLATSVTAQFFTASFCICLFYRPPSSPVHIFDDLCNTLCQIIPFSFSTFLLIGDFNVNFFNTSHFLYSHILDILYTFSLPCPDELLCSEEEVFHFLMQLDTTKATGPDNIPARMLKETARAITPSLTKLFNISMQQCSFPTFWKSANIVPIPKGSSLRSTPTGYRPISLLPIVSKVFEKHIYSLVSSHLHEHCPISDKQWGFQAGKSTTTALITTVHRWLSYLDCGSDIAAVFFDFKKAFDTVLHRLLIEKLHKTQLNTSIVEWIGSYLTGRSQKVVINGVSSGSTTVISGVPQGSVLGPLLFLIYIEDICCLNISSQMVLYADDLVLYKVIQNETDFMELQSDIVEVAKWVKDNSLTFNTSKCKSMLITRKMRTMPPLYLNGQVIVEVKKYKYLGVHLSLDLKWDTHITTICHKSKKLLGLMYRRFYTTVDPIFLCRLYLSLVRPILEYTCQVWDPYTQRNMSRYKNLP